jgi:colanic acid/amylovoran biosynthesis protein
LTGDDAIEPAYEARATSPGSEVGVNLRIGARAGVDREAFVGIGSVLQQFARTRGAALVGLPITVPPSKSADSSTILEALEGGPGTDESLSDIDTPRKVMERVSRCRIVVTGAYHAAVFALAQGIPAVCLAKTEYFVDKFEGLAAQFGGGLVILDPSTGDFPARLAFEMQKTWEAAMSWRAELLESAVRQIAASRKAYGRIKEVVVARQAIA